MTALESIDTTARVLESLRRIGAAGAEGGAHALSEMVGQDVQLYMPMVSMLPLIDLPRAYPPADLDRPCVAVYIPFGGDAEGAIALLLREKQRANLLRALDLPLDGDGEPDEPVTLSDMQQSALREVGNIVGSAYLNALADLGRMQILPEPPGLAEVSVAAVLGSVAAQAMQFDEYGLLIQVYMSLPDRNLLPEMLVLPRPAGLAAILDAISQGAAEAPGSHAAA